MRYLVVATKNPLRMQIVFATYVTSQYSLVSFQFHTIVHKSFFLFYYPYTGRNFVVPNAIRSPKEACSRQSRCTVRPSLNLLCFSIFLWICILICSFFRIFFIWSGTPYVVTKSLGILLRPGHQTKKTFLLLMGLIW